jgi:hypothetical protein
LVLAGSAFSINNSLSLPGPVPTEPPQTII